jgi:hypothetical protein
MAKNKSAVFKLSWVFGVFIAILFSNSFAMGDRIDDGILVLYRFDEGSGTTVRDTSNLSPAFDLTIEDSSVVTWLEGGGLSLDSATIIQSAGAASKVIDAVRQSKEITVEAWIKPANLTQSGPARIVTISQNTGNRNFTIGQDAETYKARLRSTSSSDNGKPELTAPDQTASLDLIQLVFKSNSSGDRYIYVNGEQVAADYDNAHGVGTNWDNYHLAIGNEITLNRPWLGEVHLVAIYGRALSNDEIATNYAAGSHPPEQPPSMVISSEGNVGIGTADPKAKLSVSANDDGDMVNVYSPADNTLAIQTTLDNEPIGTYGDDSQNRLVLQPTIGNVGIGITSPQDKLDVNGYVRSNGNRLTSDARWKGNINSIENSLERITQLRGVTYEWTDKSKGEGEQLGVIAQEVEELFPQVVHTDNQGYKSVEYSKLVAPLIEAVKSLSAENDALKERIARLEASGTK